MSMCMSQCHQEHHHTQSSNPIFSQLDIWHSRTSHPGTWHSRTSRPGTWHPGASYLEYTILILDWSITLRNPVFRNVSHLRTSQPGTPHCRTYPTTSLLRTSGLEAAHLEHHTQYLYNVYIQGCHTLSFSLENVAEVQKLIPARLVTVGCCWK